MSNTTPSADPLGSLDSGTGGLPIGQVLGILSKRKWLILACVATIPTVVGVYMSRQPKVYDATSTLVIDSSIPQYLGQNFRDAVEMEASWWSAQEALATEIRILQSRSQAIGVARALCTKKLDPKDEQTVMQKLMPWVDCNSEQSLMEIAAPNIQAMLRVDPIRDSRVVQLGVRYRSPELAAAVVNQHAQTYVQRNLERRTTTSEGAATFLSDEYSDLQTQLNNAEQSLIEFKKKNNILAVAIDEQQNELSTRRRKLSEELSNISVKLMTAKATRDYYRGIDDDPTNTAQPGITDAGIVPKLKDLYMTEYGKLADLRSKYLENHPTLDMQEKRVAAIRADLKREVQLGLKGIDVQYTVWVQQEKTLRSALDAATRESLALEQRAIEYNRLKRNFDRLSKLSETLGGRERETALAGRLKMNNVRVLDAALVPVTPIAPNVPRSIGVAFAVSLLIGFGLAFLLELADSSVRTQDDMERLLGVPFLGLIPKISEEPKSSEVAPPPALAAAVKSETGKRDLYALVYPKSAVAECARAIRTNLLFARPDDPPKTLLITSAGPQDGKTTTSINLAISLAQSGLRVLLIDTDMRKPRLHKVFGIPGSSEGLSKAILGEVDPLKVVRETGVSGLSLLPCGAIPPNPAELLHSEKFKTVLATLATHYDRVLLDSPPVDAVTDSSILAQLTDGTIFVAKSHKTAKAALARARRALNSHGTANLLGCVLNDIDLSKQTGYEYYYYSRYGSYYGKSEDEIAKEASGTPS